MANDDGTVELEIDDITPPPIDISDLGEPKGYATEATVARHHQEVKAFQAATVREFRGNDRRHSVADARAAQLEKRADLIEERLNGGAKTFSAIWAAIDETNKLVSPLRPTLWKVLTFAGPVLTALAFAIWWITRYPTPQELVQDRQRIAAQFATDDARINAGAVEAAQHRALLERVLHQMDVIDGKLDRLRP